MDAGFATITCNQLQTLTPRVPIGIQRSEQGHGE